MLFNFFKTIPSISTKELEGLITRNTQLIDVRTPAEFQRGHVRFSQNIPLNLIQSFKPRQSEEPVYVICQSGARSNRASRILQKQGFDVVNVRGGMSQWTGPISGPYSD